MMKVCLVSPPTVTAVENRWMLEVEATQPLLEGLPLGILTLAGGLLAEGIDVEVVDADLLAFDFVRSGEHDRGTPFARYAGAHLAGLEADIFGFGTICSGYPATIRIAEELKKLHPAAPIVLGGPQASVVDVATLAKFGFIDYVLRGEADSTLIEFVRRLASQENIAEVSGLTYRSEGSVHRNTAPGPTRDLDGLGLPAYHLHPYSGRLRSIPLEVGRGCPFGCSFCSTNDFFRRRFRLKSPDRVIAEMDFLAAQYAPDFFDFVHDMFTVDRRRVVAFCEALLAAGRNYKWGCSARTDCLDPELIDLMSAAGCVAIFFGIESGSDRIQKAIGKCLDLEEAARHVELCTEAGITTTVSCIVGFPEEEDADLRSTLRFIGQALRNPNSLPQLHILCPLPETPIHARFRDQLALEGVCSAVSHPGWSQDQTERELIAASPDVFPNFYAIPTPYLDRGRVHELREFYLKCIHRFRWILIAWFARTNDLLSIFDEWKDWRSGSIVFGDGFEMRRYYATWEFDRQFVDFLVQRPAELTSVLETAVIAFEVALSQGIEERGEPPSPQPLAETLASDMHLGLERYVYPISLNYDLSTVVKLLANGAGPDSSIYHKGIFVTRLISEQRVEVLEVPPLAAKFLQLCSKPRRVSEILDEFAELCADGQGLDPVEAAELTLSVLYREGLLRVYPSPVSALDTDETLRSFA